MGVTTLGLCVGDGLPVPRAPKVRWPYVWEEAAPEAVIWQRRCSSADWLGTSASSCSKLQRVRSSFQGYDQGYGNGFGAAPGQGPSDDYNAEEDDDPAAEEEMAEKEEVLNDTLGKAKQVMDVMKRVESQMDASKAQLVEIGAKAIDFKARFRFRNAAAAANAAAHLTAQPGEVNQRLQALSEEAQQLEDQMAYTKVGTPFRYRMGLLNLAGEAERAEQLMEGKIDSLREALRMLKYAGGEFVDVTDVDGEPGEPGEPAEVEAEGGGGSSPNLSDVQADAVQAQEAQMPTAGMSDHGQWQGQWQDQQQMQAGMPSGFPGQPLQTSLMGGGQWQGSHGGYGGSGGDGGGGGFGSAMGQAEQMAAEERMMQAQTAAMSGVTASKAEEEASAKELEDAMEDTTWSIDVLPVPQPLDVEPQEPAPAGLQPLAVAQTSSGCECDPTAKCALQGQPFTWCRVGTAEEPTCAKLDAAEDPTGRDHALGAQGRQWDYCVPPGPVPEEEGHESGHHGDHHASHQYGATTSHEADHGGAEADQAPEEELTSHLGCECAPRPDVLEKYLDDPLFHNLATGEIDINKIPFKDRVTVEAMQSFLENGGDLCQQTPNSGQFLVCPVAKGCAGSNVAGPGGALPSGWFSGVSGKSWDFCAPAPKPPPAAEAVDQGVYDQSGDGYVNQQPYDQYAAYGQPGQLHYQGFPGEVATWLATAASETPGRRSSRSSKVSSFL